mmetsp:Transcript_28655/g.54870  ORF Transcript_28655/g.54870 Transcript_28655/m.54870 type:complete len:147 (+) Transcript_28655:1634-2074(+)|eukprot:CAMPEP_0114247376 /NCGR_PEP_ID=MMETSP0058-20121206/12990_1 /TAXON_ID=36894 /ORGANISM="Pyramimonas parkeae, CCMP726" /LENGTH=146 /DNA_ID=CAMNT_0001360679 /DNA_START=1587 /DNA_END=2027 /DNA_ORIENTATION=-
MEFIAILLTTPGEYDDTLIKDNQILHQGQKKKTVYDKLFLPGKAFVVAFRGQDGWTSVKHGICTRTMFPREDGKPPEFLLVLYDTDMTRRVTKSLMNVDGRCDKMWVVQKVYQWANHLPMKNGCSVTTFNQYSGIIPLTIASDIVS